MWEFYPTVDICINPSLQEWLPTTVIEALGMGCYVIATDVGGTNEIPGVKLIPSWDIESLKDAILEGLKNLPDRTRQYTLPFSLENMEENYRELFGK